VGDSAPGAGVCGAASPGAVLESHLLASTTVSRLLLLTSLLVSAIVGLGVGYWVGTQGDSGPGLPPSRSKTTVPDDFAPPGVTGEVRQVLLEPDLLARTAALSSLLERLGPESLEQVREAYDSVFLDLGDTELVLFGGWWARFDPATAMVWTNRNWGTRNSIPVVRAVMRAWGRSDPRAALTATMRAPNAMVKRRWTDSVLRGWDESVQDGALEWAETLGHGPDRQWALYVVTRRRVLRDGPEAALAWAEGLPDDDELFKLNAFRRVAGAVANVDPQLATTFAERHLEGPYAKSLPTRVGMRWVERQPEAAMRWLSSLPAGTNRDDGVQDTYFQWLTNDRVAAREWLPGVEHDGWLDPAVSIYAKSFAREDPVAALQWASGIHDPELRNPTMGVIARQWLVSDEASANAWLDQSGLPESFIEKIRTIPESMRKPRR